MVERKTEGIVVYIPDKKLRDFTSMKPKIILPYAPVLVESTQSIGYSFEVAISDIIDNSISKSAQNINILFSSASPKYLAVIDDGKGMDAQMIGASYYYASGKKEYLVI